MPETQDVRVVELRHEIISSLISGGRSSSGGKYVVLRAKRRLHDGAEALTGLGYCHIVEIIVMRRSKLQN